MEKMLKEAIDMYKSKGADSVYEINRIYEQSEYINSVNELRKADRLFQRMNKDYEDSPEIKLIKRERNEKAESLIKWVSQMLSAYDEEAWEIWREFNVDHIPMKEIAKKRDYSMCHLYKINRRVQELIKKILPIYEREHGSVEDLKRYKR